MGSTDIDLKIIGILVFFLAIFYFLSSAFMYDSYSADPRMDAVANGGVLGFATSITSLIGMIYDGTIPFEIVAIFGAPIAFLLGVMVLRLVRN